MNKHELWELQSMQAAPLSVKIMLTKDRIREWIKTFGEDGVYVSFSGGKDSTVLLHLVRENYPNVPAVFCDVPTQYPELKRFAQTFDNVEIVKPKISFVQVCEQYGFPLISKEVAETVSGARKYLTKVIEEMDATTDRQTDSISHTPTDTIGCSASGSIKLFAIQRADAQSIKNLTGGVQQKVSETQRNRGIYAFEWNKLNGIGKYSTQWKNVKSGGWRSTKFCQSYRNQV